MLNIQILEVATRELLVGNDLDLAIGLLRDLNGVPKVSGAALNLNAVVKELLESLDIEDLIVDGLRAVDDELDSMLNLILMFFPPCMENVIGKRES